MLCQDISLNFFDLVYGAYLKGTILLFDADATSNHRAAYGWQSPLGRAIFRQDMAIIDVMDCISHTKKCAIKPRLEEGSGMQKIA
jgi:hypothetical protein